MPVLDLEMSISEGSSFFQLLSFRLSDVSIITLNSMKVIAIQLTPSVLCGTHLCPGGPRDEKSRCCRDLSATQVQETPRGPDIHSISNFPSDLHERTRRSEGARDVIWGFIFLRRPASQKWIQIGCDEWHWNGLGVHKRTEFASDVKRPRCILKRDVNI